MIYVHHIIHRELVRKKALLAMHHFQLISPSSVSHLHDEFRSSLSDPDPGVMAAALILLHEIIKVCLSVCLSGLAEFEPISLEIVSHFLLLFFRKMFLLIRI